jgi:hypothetical protein
MAKAQVLFKQCNVKWEIKSAGHQSKTNVPQASPVNSKTQRLDK